MLKTLYGGHPQTVVDDCTLYLMDNDGTPAQVTIGGQDIPVSAQNNILTWNGQTLNDGQTLILHTGNVNYRITYSASAGTIDVANFNAYPVATTTTALAAPIPSVYGQSVTFTATVSANLPGSGTPTGTVAFTDGTAVLGTATLDASGHAAITTSVLTAGQHAISASYDGDANFTASASGGLTQTVNAALLTITADNQSKAYGAELPELTANYSGFVNGDTPASLTSQPTVTTTADATSHVGTYAITADGAVDPDYTISYVDGTLSVTPVALTITADNQSKAYGAALPAPTANYSGFVNGDTADSLTSQPTVSTTADATSHVGTYAITADGAVDADYAIAYVNGSLTITPAATTVVATSNSGSSTVGRSAIFTATVTPSSGSSPTGTVQFQIDGNNVGSPVLSPAVQPP